MSVVKIQYVAIHEQAKLLKIPSTSTFYLCHFIDDGLVIWLHDLDPPTNATNWAEFKSTLTSGGPSWTFTKQCPIVQFIDMATKIVSSHTTTMVGFSVQIAIAYDTNSPINI